MNAGQSQSGNVAARILMITCQYPPDVYGGAEQQCRRLSMALTELGYHVQILTSSQKKGEKFDDGKLPVTRIHTGVAPDLLGRWFIFSLYWLTRVVIWGFAHRDEFDVIHCHQGKYGGFVGSVLGKLLRKPVLIKIGNSGVDMDLRCLRRKWLFGPFCHRFMMGVQPLIVAITKDIEADLKEDGWQRTVYIPNGVSRELRPDLTTRTLEPGTHLFYHGRIEAIKRVPLLVEAFSHIKSADAKLHIYGDGADLPAVVSTVERLGLQERVKVWGRQSDILSHIAKLDVFVNASRAEGFSNSLLEALLCEKVLVSTQVSGARDAIAEGENGAIASADTPESLAVAIEAGISLLHERQASVRLVCREKIEHCFAMDLIAKRYTELYANLMADPQGAGAWLAPNTN